MSGRDEHSAVAASSERLVLGLKQRVSVVEVWEEVRCLSGLIWRHTSRPRALGGHDRLQAGLVAAAH